jgi:hypothetical protein
MPGRIKSNLGADQEMFQALFIYLVIIFFPMLFIEYYNFSSSCVIIFHHTLQKFLLRAHITRETLHDRSRSLYGKALTVNVRCETRLST